MYPVLTEPMFVTSQPKNHTQTLTQEKQLGLEAYSLYYACTNTTRRFKRTGWQWDAEIQTDSPWSRLKSIKLRWCRFEGRKEWQGHVHFVIDSIGGGTVSFLSLADLQNWRLDSGNLKMGLCAGIMHSTSALTAWTQKWGSKKTRISDIQQKFIHEKIENAK